MDLTEFGFKIGSILCPTCKKSSQSLTLDPDGPKKWKCVKCETSYGSDMVSQVLINMRNKAHGLKSLGIEYFEKFLVGSKLLIHETHEAMLEVKYALFFQYGSNKTNGLSSKLAKFILQNFNLNGFVNLGTIYRGRRRN